MILNYFWFLIDLKILQIILGNQISQEVFNIHNCLWLTEEILANYKLMMLYVASHGGAFVIINQDSLY